MTEDIMEIEPVVHHDTHALMIDSKDAPERRILRRGRCSCGWSGPWYTYDEPLEESLARHLRSAAA